MRVLQIVTIIKITNKIMRKFMMMISIGAVGLMSCQKPIQLESAGSLKAKAKADLNSVGNTYYVDPSR